MTEPCSHADKVCNLVDRFQQWKGYECPYCEIDRLRAALKTVGDDYPGSSCQKWCYEQAGIALPDLADEVLRRFARAAEIQAERCERTADVAGDATE